MRALLVFAVLFGVWLAGTFDRPLSEVGLNRNPCVQNGFGAKFCGNDATSYCRDVAAIAPSADCAQLLEDKQPADGNIPSDELCVDADTDEPYRCDPETGEPR